MKKIILLLLTIKFAMSIVQAQPIGFVEPECGIVSNSSYYFTNYLNGSHGCGYSLYHNGILIKNQSADFGGYIARELKFIDNNIGFFVVDKSGGTVIIYKIIGDSIIGVGYAPGSFLASFIINAYIAYIVSDTHFFWPDKFLSVNKCSDIQPHKNLIDDTLYISDITVYDTIVGSPLCNNLNEVHYKSKNGNDTITYTIILNVIDSAFSINEITLNDWNFFPNPTSSTLTIQTPSKSTIEIHNLQGQIIRTIKAEGKETTIDVADLASGVYIIKAIMENGVAVRKFVKE